jgi:hypothetical protein
VPLPDLDPDHLIVLTFGPGVGELILLRVPPDVWMVVDGCSAGTIDYATAVLARYQARPRLVLLTHPHNDHSRGLANVIEAATPREHQDTWPRIGMVLPPGNDGAARAAGFVGGATLKAISAITSRWSAFPACRWDVNVGDVEPLGDATLHVLSPPADLRAQKLELWKTREQFDKNVIATALLLSWRGRRVLLGSDLVEHPGDGWSHCLVLDPELGDHDLFKVPHHGADDALHDDVLRPRARVSTPLRTITPYSTSRLPESIAEIIEARFDIVAGAAEATEANRRLVVLDEPREDANLLDALGHLSHVEAVPGALEEKAPVLGLDAPLQQIFQAREHALEALGKLGLDGLATERDHEVVVGVVEAEALELLANRGDGVERGEHLLGGNKKGSHSRLGTHLVDYGLEVGSRSIGPPPESEAIDLITKRRANV